MALGTPYKACGGNAAAGSATLAVTVTHATSAGDAVAVWVSSSSANITGVSDSKSNSYTQLGSPVASGSRNGQWWVALNATALTTSDTITLTCSGTTGTKTLSAIGCSGVKTASALDQQPASVTGNSSAPSVSSGTLAQSSELALAGEVNANGGGAITWGGSFASPAVSDSQASSGNQYGQCAAITTSATTALTASGTIFSTTWGISLITLEAAPAGTSVTGVTAALALGAPAGTVSAGADVTGVAAGLALAAAAGDVSKGAGAAGSPAALTFTAPAGTATVVATQFPGSTLDLRAELLLSGTWTGISAWLDHGPVTIGRGHPDESTTVSPSTLAMTLTNTDGRFTAKNPAGPWYGSLGRNVPVRISIPAQTTYLRLEDDTASYVSAPDAAGLDITGDTEIQIDLHASTVASILAAKYNDGSAERSWLLQLNGDSTVTLYWSANGTALLSAQSTQPIPTGRVAIKATLKCNNGSGGNTVTFWTAATIAGPWTQLGSAVTQTGTTSVFDSTAPVCIGGDPDYSGTAPGMNGSVHGFRLLNGIGGTTVAYADFTSQPAGTTSFTDGQGNTWTLAGTAEISGRLYRGHFEAADWPQHSYPGEKDVTVAVAGGGLLRRLGQRNEPIDSPVRRAILNLSGTLTPHFYWPAEDVQGSTAVGAALGGTLLTVASGATPTAFAGDSSFACSAPIPTVNNGIWYAALPVYTSNGSLIIRFLLDAASAPTNTILMRIVTSGTAKELNLTFTTGGTPAGELTFKGKAAGGGSVFTSGATAFGLTANPSWVSLELTPSGGNVDWNIAVLNVGTTTSLTASGSYSGSIGVATAIYVNDTAAALSAGIGHITIQSAYELIDTYYQPLQAWSGETAGNRFARLCSEEGVQFRATGDLDATMAMGPQDPQTLTQLLQECADADRGAWTELRQQLGFGYTTLGALCQQAPAVTVDYAQDHLEMWSSEPLEDDQTTVNDVTLTQSATTGAHASSYRAYAAPGQPVDGGALSSADPPSGVGSYDQSYSVNLDSDSSLPDVAGWILHAGTVDEPRYPGIVLDLTNRDLAALFWQILGLDVGQRLVIDDLPVWLPPDPASQIAQQLTENLWANRLDITVTGVPESPYEVALYDDVNFGRADTDGSTLASAVSSTATSLSVATTSAATPIWTTAAADFPFDISIGGERITVTNITGSSSPQAFTVTRSVNGVVKAQASGADVRLWYPPVYAVS